MEVSHIEHARVLDAHGGVASWVHQSTRAKTWSVGSTWKGVLAQKK